MVVLEEVSVTPILLYDGDSLLLPLVFRLDGEVDAEEEVYVFGSSAWRGVSMEEDSFSLEVFNDSEVVVPFSIVF